MSARYVTQLVAEKHRTRFTAKHSLLEYNPQLATERILEEHEKVVEVKIIIVLFSIFQVLLSIYLILIKLFIWESFPVQCFSINIHWSDDVSLSHFKMQPFDNDNI